MPGVTYRLAATPHRKFRPPRSMRWSLRGMRPRPPAPRWSSPCAYLRPGRGRPGCPTANGVRSCAAPACLCSTRKTPQLIWIPTWSMYVRPAVLLCSSSGPAFIQTTCAVPPPYICLPPPYVPRAGSGKRAKRFSTGASLFPLILSSSGTRASALSSAAPPRSPC